MILDDLFNKDNADFRFRPEYGAFRARLAEILIAAENEEFADLFSECSSDMLVSIGGNSFSEGMVRCQVFSDMGERSLECALSQLSQQELDDLKEQLARLDGSQPAPVVQLQPQNVVRKKAEIDLLNMLTIDEAAGQLNLSKQLLKSRIPCTDYSYVEVDGKVEIKEYYWSKDLIRRLGEIKKRGANAEDVKYFADESCHGDQGWAKDILGMLTQKNAATNRDNAAPKGGAKQQAADAAPKNHGHRHHRNRQR